MQVQRYSPHGYFRSSEGNYRNFGAGQRQHGARVVVVVVVVMMVVVIVVMVVVLVVVLVRRR